jgi:hypothetical protein
MNETDSPNNDNMSTDKIEKNITLKCNVESFLISKFIPKYPDNNMKQLTHALKTLLINTPHARLIPLASKKTEP